MKTQELARKLHDVTTGAYDSLGQQNRTDPEIYFLVKNKEGPGYLHYKVGACGVVGLDDQERPRNPGTSEIITIKVYLEDT